MDVRAFVDRVRADEDRAPSLVHVRELPARNPRLEPFPELPELLEDRLDLLGIRGLYPHQREALELIDNGRDVILSTGTASGKTLVYNLAFARSAVVDPKRTALYLFPTKALARDQLRAVRDLRLPQVKAAVYDGDTPRDERPLIRKNANLVLSNPDMLHAGILPDHARWADFFLRLSLVVVDEAHVARGVFGSHLAMVLRRLRRLVAHYGGDPRFVLASATIGNPGELAERLVGLPLQEPVTRLPEPRKASGTSTAAPLYWWSRTWTTAISKLFPVPIAVPCERPMATTDSPASIHSVKSTFESTFSSSLSIRGEITRLSVRHL
jgi:DEAD/DEAH box helicase domain-containing protein